MRQLSGIEPVTPAIGALIDLDLAFGAEKMPVQPHAIATGTIAFARGIDGDPLVPLEMEQRFTGYFIFFIDALEFKGVEPYPTAASLTDVNDQAADLHLSQLIEASWAFHKLTLPQGKPQITPYLRRVGVS